MDEYEIISTQDFEEEFENMYCYFKFFLKANKMANTFYQTIIDSIFSLKYFPKRYHKINNFSKNNKDIRKSIIKKYIIIYEINEQKRTSYYSTYILSESRII